MSHFFFNSILNMSSGYCMLNHTLIFKNTFTDDIYAPRIQDKSPVCLIIFRLPGVTTRGRQSLRSAGGAALGAAGPATRAMRATRATRATRTHGPSGGSSFALSGGTFTFGSLALLRGEVAPDLILDTLDERNGQKLAFEECDL